MSNEARAKQEELSIELRGNYGKLSNEQLVTRIQSGIDEADNMFILWQQNQRFITMLGKRYTTHAELADLEQEGYIALCKAVEGYDSTKGVPFINYAAYWIKQYMVRYIQNCCQSVRISVHTYEDIGKYKKLMAQVMAEYGRNPTDAEISRYMRISLAQVRQLKKDFSMANIQSLDEKISGEDACIRGELVASGEDLETDVIEHLDQQKMQRQLWAIVETLEWQQAVTIKARYKENKTLKETGELLGGSIELARQLQQKALRTLRVPRNIRKLHPYYEEYLDTCAYHRVGMATFNRTWTSATEGAALRMMER